MIFHPYGRARVCVRQNYYSVPARYAGRRLPVLLSATAVDVLNGSPVVARHERAAGKYGGILVLNHYLEVLRPRAASGARSLDDTRRQLTASPHMRDEGCSPGRTRCSWPRELMPSLAKTLLR
jgi:hypothetical protein